MRRVDPAKLETSIYITLRVLRGPTRTALQHISTDRACQTVARLIIERCLAGLAMFEPDEVRNVPHPQWAHGLMSKGKFGETERWPDPPAEPTMGRCRVCGVNDVDGLGYELARVMWDALAPDRSFETASQDREHMLLIAHRAIYWLSGQGA